MVGEIFRTYSSLREQARKALQARSTAIVIAQYQPSEPRTKYLYLHPTLWAISALHALKRGMLEVALPHANDPEPLRNLAKRVDSRLQGWLQEVVGGLEGRDRDTLLRLTRSVPTLEQEIAGARGRAVV